MSNKSKRAVIYWATFLAGLYFLAEFVLPGQIPGTTICGFVTSASDTALTILPLTQTLDAGPFREGLYRDAVDNHLLAISDLLDGTPVRAKLDQGKSVQARIISATPREVRLGIVGPPQVVRITSSLDVVQLLPGGKESDPLPPNSLKPNQLVRIGHTTYISRIAYAMGDLTNVLIQMALGVGLISLAMLHLNKVSKRKENSGFSILLLAAMVFGLLVGWFRDFPRGTIPWQIHEVTQMHVGKALGSTIFSILAFYMTTAAYRAFKVRNWEASTLAGAALIVILGQVPLGHLLTSPVPEPLQIPSLSHYLLSVANSSAYRALLIGIILGTLATSLRFWLSLERGAYFEREL